MRMTVLFNTSLTLKNETKNDISNSKDIVSRSCRYCINDDLHPDNTTLESVERCLNFLDR